jgi:DNA-binding XRE family transcriptional regulator
MATTLKDKMQALDVKRRKKVEVRATELIAEEMSLRDLRKAMVKTQVKMAKALGIKQEGVSRIEKRSDLLLSTLRGYVEAMGGELHLIAEFPDRPPVALSGVAKLEKQLHTLKPASSRQGSKDKHPA